MNAMNKLAARGRAHISPRRAAHPPYTETPELRHRARSHRAILSQSASYLRQGCGPERRAVAPLTPTVVSQNVRAS